MVRASLLAAMLALSMGLNAFLLGYGRLSLRTSWRPCTAPAPAVAAPALDGHCTCQKCEDPPPCPAQDGLWSEPGKFRQLAFYDMHTVLPQLQLFFKEVNKTKPYEFKRYQNPGKHGDVHSQWGQEFHVASYLNCSRNGFFVDLAANIAIDNSNTLTLERDFGWRGILIEANPKYWWGLLHRNASLFLGPVGAADERVTFNLHDETSGIVGSDFDRKPGSGGISYTTTSLASVLRHFGAPRQIDFFSLDVEGAESLVMKDFPWDTYNFSVLNVERPKPDLQQWLADHGYILLRSNPGWDETYIHRNFEAVKAKWTGEGNIDLPLGCMDQLGYEHPWNTKWPPHGGRPRPGGLTPSNYRNPPRPKR